MHASDDQRQKLKDKRSSENKLTGQYSPSCRRARGAIRSSAGDRRDKPAGRATGGACDPRATTRPEGQSKMTGAMVRMRAGSMWKNGAESWQG